MPHPASAAFAVAVCSALVVSGCSSVSTPSAAPDGGSAAPAASSATLYPNACTLLTAADAEAAIGEAVDAQPVMEDHGEQGSVCHYSSPTKLHSVEIGVADPARQRALVQPGEPVAGLGDEATFHDSTMFVRADQVGLFIMVVKPGEQLPASKEDTLRELAQRALARL